MTNSEVRGTRLHKIALTQKVHHDEKQLIVSQSANGSNPIAEGHFFSYQCDQAFALHGGNSYELMNSQVVSTAPPAVIVTLLLEGKLDFGYDDLAFKLEADQRPQGVMVNLAKAANFRRALQANVHVVKVNMMFHPHWIQTKLGLPCGMDCFLEHHKNHLNIRMTPEIIRLAGELIALPSPKSFIERMKMESLTYQLMAHICQQSEAGTIHQCHCAQTANQYGELEDMISYIETHLSDPLNLEQLAQQFSMSVSNLQRRFKQQLGMTVNLYIRQRRLEIAKQHLESGLVTITEAAYDAGYQHPSNFTIAFKKAFGQPPTAFVKL